MKQWRVVFSGKVQGVGFRFTACQAARELGVTGWVRNLPDGRVEMVAEGPDPTGPALIQRICDTTFGVVDDYQTEIAPPTGQFADFSVRHA